MSRQCPICGAVGEDLIFKFWCSKSRCQNFNPKIQPSKHDITCSVTDELRTLWRAHAPELSEEEFLIKFFATGGRFALQEGRVVLKHKPAWLR